MESPFKLISRASRIVINRFVNRCFDRQMDNEFRTIDDRAREIVKQVNNRGKKKNKWLISTWRRRFYYFWKKFATMIYSVSPRLLFAFTLYLLGKQTFQSSPRLRLSEITNIYIRYIYTTQIYTSGEK